MHVECAFNGVACVMRGMCAWDQLIMDFFSSCMLWWAFDEVAYVHVKIIEIMRMNYLVI